jgi:hypothetical protein
MQSCQTDKNLRKIRIIPVLPIVTTTKKNVLIILHSIVRQSPKERTIQIIKHLNK